MRIVLLKEDPANTIPLKRPPGEVRHEAPPAKVRKSSKKHQPRQDPESPQTKPLSDNFHQGRNAIRAQLHAAVARNEHPRSRKRNDEDDFLEENEHHRSKRLRNEDEFSEEEEEHLEGEVMEPEDELEEPPNPDEDECYSDDENARQTQSQIPTFQQQTPPR